MLSLRVNMKEQMNVCTCDGLSRALHAAQDSFAAGHAGFQSWCAHVPSVGRVFHDSYPSARQREKAIRGTTMMISMYNNKCDGYHCIR